MARYRSIVDFLLNLENKEFPPCIRLAVFAYLCTYRFIGLIRISTDSRDMFVAFRWTAGMRPRMRKQTIKVESSQQSRRALPCAQRYDRIMVHCSVLSEGKFRNWSFDGKFLCSNTTRLAHAELLIDGTIWSTTTNDDDCRRCLENPLPT